jgi:hypothetical protein
VNVRKSESDQVPMIFAIFSALLLIALAALGVFEAIPMDIIGVPLIFIAYAFIFYSIYFVLKHKYSWRFFWALAFLFIPFISHLIFWFLFRQREIR